MCGICGAIDFEYKGRVHHEAIETMMDTIKYRGPDSSNYIKRENFILGFNRLAIIGINNGNQPIWNEKGTICLICNGEIFNYLELKKELIEKGHVFRTESDVEVIIHLYEEYGEMFVDMLNGQFAFVLVHEEMRKVICARDHFGISPLYYTIVENVLIFASEIKSILNYPYIKKEIDIKGLDQILTFPGLISPQTMFKDIYSLENGHYLVIEEQQIRNVEYWDMNYPQAKGELYHGDIFQYAEELYDRLETSISLRLRSDVPVGSYVSGGLDSSFIAAMISHIRNGERFHTFSIGFSDEKLSEVKYQRLMASKLKSEHHEIILSNEDIINRLKTVIYHCECPLKETYNAANFALSESVRKSGIKVVMSGEGSDELFAGYVGYKFDRYRAEGNFLNQIELQSQMMNYKLWDDPFYVYERNISELDKIKCRLYSDSVNEHFDSINACNNFVINKEKIRGVNLVHRRAYIDYKLRLVDHLVCDHGDKMGLGNAVELRYPFLDKNLFEFVSTIPTNLLLNNFEEKYLFRKCIDRIKMLPKEIINREKFEFTAIGSPQLLKAKNPYIEDILDYDRIKAQGIFNPNNIEKLKKQYCSDDFILNLPFENDLLLIVITTGILLDNFDIQKVMV